MPYSKKEIELGALKSYLNNIYIEYNNKLLNYVEENNAVDLIYAEIKYQITMPAAESNVVGRIINGDQKMAIKGGLKGSRFEPSRDTSIPMFTGTYGPSDAWQEFVIGPISRKVTTDGEGITLLIFCPIIIPAFIYSGDYNSSSFQLPESSFDHIILVDSFRNVVLK